MPSRLNARLERLERSDSTPNGARVDHVLSLLDRLEEATGQTLAEVFHGLECGRRSLAPLRDPGTVPEIDAVVWFAAVTNGNRVRLTPPLCPLCSGPSAA